MRWRVEARGRTKVRLEITGYRVKRAESNIYGVLTELSRTHVTQYRRLRVRVFTRIKGT